MAVRVYMASSLDGFIAGPDDELGWLHDPAFTPDPSEPTEALGFEDFMAQVGAMLMGRTTYDVVAAMGVWPYGETPVLVATRRPLEPVAPTVRAVQGDIGALLDEAQRIAGAEDVYLDSGQLIRNALDAGLVDELCITLIPILLGTGVSLYQGLTARAPLEFVSHHRYGGMLQLTARPRRGDPRGD